MNLGGHSSAQYALTLGVPSNDGSSKPGKSDFVSVRGCLSMRPAPALSCSPSHSQDPVQCPHCSCLISKCYWASECAVVGEEPHLPLKMGDRPFWVPHLTISYQDSQRNLESSFCWLASPSNHSIWTLVKTKIRSLILTFASIWKAILHAESTEL